MRAGAKFGAAFAIVGLATDVFPSSPCVLRTPQQTIDGSTIAVVGAVVSVRPVDIDGVAALKTEGTRGLYRVRVIEEFKGKRQAEYELIGDLPRPTLPPGRVYLEDEGFIPAVGKRYVLFGWDSPLRIDGCGSTAYDEARDLMKALRKYSKERSKKK